jgi:hypothetical protein
MKQLLARQMDPVLLTMIIVSRYLQSLSNTEKLISFFSISVYSLAFDPSSMVSQKKFI